MAAPEFPERTAAESLRRFGGMVAAGHPLTALAGTRALLGGGNAFDAVVAAGIAAAVVEPTSSNSLAAECVGQLYRADTGSLHVLSGQGGAPLAATSERFRALGLDRIPTGPGEEAHLAFTVPGALGAYLLVLERYGTKSVKEVFAPAIGYCEDGFPVYPQMHQFLALTGTRLQSAFYPPGPAAIFYPGGEPAPIGHTLRQPQLGRTLRRLVEASRRHADRQAGIAAARATFYGGTIGRELAGFAKRWGGLLKREDLTQYEAKLEEPLHTTYAGYEVYTQGPWTQAPVLLQALNMLENFELGPLGHNSPDYIHIVAEVLKLCFADRDHYYADPDFVAVPIERLLSKEYARARAQLVKTSPCPDLQLPGECGSDMQPFLPFAAQVCAEENAGKKGGTTHFVAVDPDGNIASVTASGGSLAKSAFATHLGFAPSTRSEMFSLDPRHPNSLQPGKRPRTTLVNYMLCREQVPVISIGCPGGDDQAQANLQILLNIVVFGMELQRAVSEPRFSTQALTSSFFPRESRPNQLNLEEGIPAAVADTLAEKGHAISRAADCGLGAIAVQRDPGAGTWTAGVDPRRPTCAIAW